MVRPMASTMPVRLSDAHGCTLRAVLVWAMSRVGTGLRFRAAAHELRCWECRVTWRSWLQRLIGDRRGYSPAVPVDGEQR